MTTEWERPLMDVLYDWAPAILILGLVLAAVGAGVAARAVILTQLQADALASTQRNVNDALRDALLRQSRAAAWGLGLVALGTIVQIAGTADVAYRTARPILMTRARPRPRRRPTCRRPVLGNGAESRPPRSVCEPCVARWRRAFWHRAQGHRHQ
jgi:hypothetical protein